MRETTIGWAATLHADHVQPWRAGQPARPLCVDGGPRDRGDDRRSLVFVRRGVLAVGGDGLDLWDLEAGTHLGRLDQTVTALCAQGGQLYAGDAKGRVFRIDVPVSAPALGVPGGTDAGFMSSRTRPS